MINEKHFGYNMYDEITNELKRIRMKNWIAWLSKIHKIILTELVNVYYEDVFEIIEASIYIGHYFNVCNHKATHMMQSSKCDDNIVRTEFSGTPVRGKKGGFSTGPQEQLALVGMGMSRFVREVNLIRSDYCNVPMRKMKSEEIKEEEKIKVETGRKNDDDGTCEREQQNEKEEEEEEEEIFAGSTTFKRMNDDLSMRDLNVTYKVRKLYE